jgi:hypothetical protein
VDLEVVPSERPGSRTFLATVAVLVVLTGAALAWFQYGYDPVVEDPHAFDEDAVRLTMSPAEYDAQRPLPFVLAGFDYDSLHLTRGPLRGPDQRAWDAVCCHCSIIGCSGDAARWVQPALARATPRRTSQDVADEATDAAMRELHRAELRGPRFVALPPPSG